MTLLNKSLNPSILTLSTLVLFICVVAKTNVFVEVDIGDIVASGSSIELSPGSIAQARISKQYSIQIGPTHAEQAINITSIQLSCPNPKVDPSQIWKAYPWASILEIRFSNSWSSSPTLDVPYHFKVLSSAIDLLNHHTSISLDPQLKSKSCALFPPNHLNRSESGLLCFFEHQYCHMSLELENKIKTSNGGKVKFQGRKWQMDLPNSKLISSEDFYFVSASNNENASKFDFEQKKSLVVEIIHSGDRKVKKIQTSPLKRSLEKQGMHRELHTSVLDLGATEIQVPEKSNYFFSTHLVEFLPQDVFVDQYEVEEISRFGGSGTPITSIFRDIDVEKPAYLSPQNVVILSLNHSTDINSISKMNEARSGTLEFSLPIHLRYQRPSFSENFKNVSIIPPLIITQFSYNKIHERISNTLISKIFHGDYIPDVEDQFLFIHEHVDPTFVLNTLYPTGQWNDEDFVKMVTFGVTAVLSLATILTMIIKHRLSRA